MFRPNDDDGFPDKKSYDYLVSLKDIKNDVENYLKHLKKEILSLKIMNEKDIESASNKCIEDSRKQPKFDINNCDDLKKLLLKYAICTAMLKNLILLPNKTKRELEKTDSKQIFAIRSDLATLIYYSHPNTIEVLKHKRKLDLRESKGGRLISTITKVINNPPKSTIIDCNAPC